MKILFVCKHNRFRSKVAEAIFNKLNKNKKINVESAGTVGSIDSVHENVIKIMREKGYIIDNIIPIKTDSIKINNYDLLVIVADNVEKKFFTSSGFKGKIIKWNINDCFSQDIVHIRKIVDEIEKDVKVFLESLKNVK